MSIKESSKIGLEISKISLDVESLSQDLGEFSGVFSTFKKSSNNYEVEELANFICFADKLTADYSDRLFEIFDKLEEMTIKTQNSLDEKRNYRLAYSFLNDGNIEKAKQVLSEALEK